VLAVPFVQPALGQTGRVRGFLLLVFHVNSSVLVLRGGAEAIRADVLGPLRPPLLRGCTGDGRVGSCGRRYRQRRHDRNAHSRSGGSATGVAKRASMWKQDESGRVHTPLEPVVLAATLALIPILIVEADATSRGWQQFAEVANWIIWAIFAVELAAVLVVASRKRAALRAHWLDVAIVVLTIPLLGKALAWLRLARFIRLARFGVIVARALQAERRLTSGDSLRIAALLTMTAVIVGGAAQHTVAAGEFGNLWDGVWWSVVTVTTVGYGDLYPKSVGGRLIGMALMFVGIGFLSLLTAAVASRFVREERSEEYDEMMETLRRIEADVAELKSRASSD
jgi:voltage-gated potassium channel